MTQDVYVLGSFTTRFQRWPEKSIKALTREAFEGVLSDAGMATGSDISAAWFSNCLMHMWGQSGSRGNMAFIPLVREGLFPKRSPIINVEGGCSSGSLALHGAWQEIRTGDADLTLAIGVEKLFDPIDPARMVREFEMGLDNLDPQEWRDYYTKVGHLIGHPFEPGPDRTVVMDTYAMQALAHMKKYGTTSAQIAYGASKNHNHGAMNPLAQYHFEMTPEEVLADRPITHPLTRAMCAPMGDGAAAAILCSAAYLRKLPAETQRRAVRIRGIALAGGNYRELDEPSLTRHAADLAYERAGVGPEDIDLAEVHDATSFCEIYQCEMLRFAAEGEGGRYVASGATKLGGPLPINTSGGLVSKGHPIGATGLSMTYELVTQLRGEAGPRQVPNPKIALQENGGGVIGLGEALAAVTIYEANR